MKNFLMRIIFALVFLALAPLLALAFIINPNAVIQGLEEGVLRNL
jgi:hypothetical protein